MIRHNAIRQNPASGKILIHPQINAKLFPLRIAKDKSPIHHTRHAVVNRRFHQRILPRSQPSRMPHTPNLPQSNAIARGFSIDCLSPCNMDHHAVKITKHKNPLYSAQYEPHGKNSRFCILGISTKSCLMPCHSGSPQMTTF